MDYYIIQWNCRSLIPKLDILKKFLQENKTDIILFQETWLKNQTPNIKDYRLISQPFSSGYQGLALLINNSIYFEQINSLTLNSIEMLAVKVKLGLSFFHIFNIYIPKPVTSENLLRELHLILQFASTKENVILAGDFNAHHEYWGSHHEDGRGILIKQIFDDYNISLLNTGEATKIKCPGERKSAIDLTFCSTNLCTDFQWKVLEENLGSDHYLISITYTSEIRYVNREPNKKLFVNKDIFKSYLNDINPNNFSDFTSLYSAIKKSIKKSTKEFNFYQSNPSDFWSDQTKEAYSIRTEALKKFNRDPTTFPDYCKAEAKFKNIRRRHKKRDKRKQIESKLTANASSTELWQTTQRITGRNIKSRRNLISENEEQAEAFLNKYFPVDNNDSSETTQFLLPIKEIYNSDLTKEFTWEEFSDFLSSRQRRSAPGHDGLSYDLIQEMNYDLKYKFLQEMNVMWNEGRIPNQLLDVKVIPIPKTGKYENKVDSYRPISLISTTIKIINGMLKNRLQLFASKNGLLEENSFGFKKEVSTTTCLNVLLNDTFSHIRNNRHLILVFIDLSSAFDKVILSILENLLLKLFPKKCVDWIMYFLQERTIFINSEGKKIYRKIKKGLAQGDILSPFLFNLYTKIIHTLTDEDTKVYQYADDFVILSKGTTKRTNMANIQYKLNQLSEICKEIGMEINVSKSAYMVIRDEDLEGVISLNIDNIQLERKNIIKYLGINFDEDLTFKSHVKQLHKDINGRLNLLKYISGFNWGAHPKTLSTVYKGIIRSKIDYGCSIYSICDKSTLKKLDSINNTALRVVTGLTRTTPLNALSAISAEPPLTLRREAIINKEIIKSIYSNNTLGKQLLSINENIYNSTNSKKLTPIETAFNSIENVIYNLDTRPFSTPIRPINLEIHTDLLNSSKNNFSSEVIRQIFSADLEKYKNFTIIYTDASLTEQKTGIGIYCSEDHSSMDFGLNLQISSTSAELIAIKVGIENGLLLGKEKILICTDSLGACQRIMQGLNSTIKDKNSTDKTVNEILQICFEHSNSFIIIKWIPGHKNIPGNEMADSLAKSGCNSNQIINVKYQLLDAINLMKTQNFEKWKSWCANLAQDKGKYYFKIRPSVESKPWYSKMKLNNNHTKTLNRLLAGHTYTKKWLAIMKIERNNTCDTCPEKIEDETHIISECTKYDTKRRQNYIIQNQSLEQILIKNEKKDLKEICKFLNEINVKI
jgi:ribonuclease HI